MKSVDKYRSLVVSLVAKGINFDLDVWNRNSRENSEQDWNELAKVYGYRRPKTAYFSNGWCFYQLLQRVYNRIKAEPDFINSVAEKVRFECVCGIK